jgi:hypothetical protein
LAFIITLPIVALFVKEILIARWPKEEVASAIFAMALLLGLLIHCEKVWAADFIVGDADG